MRVHIKTETDREKKRVKAQRKRGGERRWKASKREREIPVFLRLVEN